MDIVRVAVLFVGLLRISDKYHLNSIIQSTQGCDNYVFTYETETNCGHLLTQNNESRLLIISPKTIKYGDFFFFKLHDLLFFCSISLLCCLLLYILIKFCRDRTRRISFFPSSLYQWLLLNEGLVTFKDDLTKYDTIIRTRSVREKNQNQNQNSSLFYTI